MYHARWLAGSLYNGRVSGLVSGGLAVMLLCGMSQSSAATPRGDELWAGAAKVDITNRDVPLVNDPLYVKALVIGNEATTAVIITVDAVAIGQIGTIRNDYLDTIRTEIERDLKIPPTHVLVNASHCHGVVCTDIAERTVEAVKQAFQNMVPVNVGAGTGSEDRVMENRRLRLKSGKEADVRHAYSLPPDEAVVGSGPIDPEIGLLRIDNKKGGTVAVLYNYAGHPIQGVPNGGNTADITGFASQVIEDNLPVGAVALFIQGCGGDINPVRYKDVAQPRDARPLGNLLGLSALQGLKSIAPQGQPGITVIHERLKLPRADLAARITSLQAERDALVQSLKGTSLNLKTFLPLVVRYQLAPEYPSYYSHFYHHEEMLGRSDLARMDSENRKNIEAYVRNIHVMEEITRVQTNLALLKAHDAKNRAAGKTIEVEVLGLRIGDFVLVSFPGELTVQIGLNIKQRSPHPLTFVAGYSNGYIYYSPTAEQLKNVGGAQEDSDCLLAPEWQDLFDRKVDDILRRL
jgi:hypothetical protein